MIKLTKIIWEERKRTVAEIEGKLSEIATEMLSKYWDVPVRNKVKVVENRRLSRSLGRYVYNYYERYIELSGRLLDYGATEIILDVLLHEVTHLALHRSNKPFSDGNPYFESELKRVGASSTMTHTVGIIYKYDCGCTYHNSLQSNKADDYVCNKCEKPLKRYAIEYHDGIGGVITEKWS